MTARASRKKSRPSRTRTTTQKTKVDPAQLLEVYTRWHATVRGYLEGILRSAEAIAQIAEDPDEPLAEYVDQISSSELTGSLRDAIYNMLNIAPPVPWPCPIAIPDVAAYC
jgi:hypothetical protein